MTVTQATSHAFHALAYMVRHQTLLPLTCEVIAKSEGIPAGYLAKIFQKLSRAGILESMSGRNKGYTFARPPKDISLQDIFAVTEGKNLFDVCFMKHGDCAGRKDECPMYRCWREAVATVREFLKGTSIAEIGWDHADYCDKFLESLPGESDDPSRQRLPLSE